MSTQGARPPLRCRNAARMTSGPNLLARHYPIPGGRTGLPYLCCSGRHRAAAVVRPDGRPASGRAVSRRRPAWRCPRTPLAPHRRFRPGLRRPSPSGISRPATTPSSPFVIFAYRFDNPSILMGKIRAMGRIQGSIVHRNFPIACFFPNLVRARYPWVHPRVTGNMRTSAAPARPAPDTAAALGPLTK